MFPKLTRSNNLPPPSKKIHVFRPGWYVWAKMDRKYWPGIIISHKDICFQSPSTGKFWIFWFGDYRVSEVSGSLLKDFCEEYENCAKKKNGSLTMQSVSKAWIQGVYEALRELGLPETKSFSTSDLKSWAKANLAAAYVKKYVVTDFVKTKLDEIRAKNFKPETDECKECANHVVRKIIKDYKTGKLSRLEICLGCYSDKISDEHPVFNGYFCVDCNKRFKRNFCKLDQNIKKECCVICGHPGSLIVCTNVQCKFVYCAMCVRDLASSNAYEILTKKKTWFCFVCTDNKTYRGALLTRHNWKENISGLVPIEKKALFKETIDKTSPETVSSNLKLLLNYINSLRNASGIHYLRKSDEEIVQITENNYPMIVKLFNSDSHSTLTPLKKRFLQNYLPIGLLVCDQRCRDDNDNDIMRPSSIIYEFYRLIGLVGQIHKVELFWIFEWNNDITLQQRTIVTRLLKKYPILINEEKRILWCNLPKDLVTNEFSLKHILFTEPSCYQKHQRV